MAKEKKKKYIVAGRLLLLGGHILSIEMQFNYHEDIPDFAKCVDYNAEVPAEELIFVTDTDFNKWLIETKKILAWGISIEEKYE